MESTSGLLATFLSVVHPVDPFTESENVTVAAAAFTPQATATRMEPAATVMDEDVNVVPDPDIPPVAGSQVSCATAIATD